MTTQQADVAPEAAPEDCRAGGCIPHRTQCCTAAPALSGRINAILDVAVPDVLPPGHLFYDLPNVFLTPHIAGSMGTELLRMGDHVVAELERYVSGQPFAHPEELS